MLLLHVLPIGGQKQKPSQMCHVYETGHALQHNTENLPLYQEAYVSGHSEIDDNHSRLAVEPDCLSNKWLCNTGWHLGMPKHHMMRVTNEPAHEGSTKELSCILSLGWAISSPPWSGEHTQYMGSTVVLSHSIELATHGWLYVWCCHWQGMEKYLDQANDKDGGKLRMLWCREQKDCAGGKIPLVLNTLHVWHACKAMVPCSFERKEACYHIFASKCVHGAWPACLAKKSYFQATPWVAIR